MEMKLPSSRRVNELGERSVYAVLKGIRSGGKEEVRKADGEWTDRPTLHGKRHRHGVVGCARIVKETPNGAENTDSASSFLSLFSFSLSLPPALPRDISSNSLLTGLSELCRVAY